MDIHSLGLSGHQIGIVEVGEKGLSHSVHLRPGESIHIGHTQVDPINYIEPFST